MGAGAVMDIQLSLPASVYERLRTAAAASGQTVTQLLEANAYRLGRADVRTDEIVRLYADGLTDSEIGQQMGVTNLVVTTCRARFGFPANRKLTKRSK